MLRAIAIILFIFFAVTGIVLVLNYDFREGLVENPEAAAVAATPALAISSFDRVGTLTYYPNNLGYQVPYLVFKTSSASETQTKALAFNQASQCTTSGGTFPCTLIADSFEHYYAGGPVEVIGTVAQEGVIVDSVRGT